MKITSSLSAAGLAFLFAAPAGAAVLLADNFTVTGFTNYYDVNYNVGRQTGSQAVQTWTTSGNAQVGNNGVFGGDGNYLMVADTNGRATLSSMNLSSFVSSNEKLEISFDIAAAPGGYGFTAFTLGGLSGGVGTSQPDASTLSFAFLLFSSTGVQAFDNGNLLLNPASTTGGSNFKFTFSDAATQTGSPFGGDASVTIQNGSNTIGTYTLNGGLSTDTYITFGMNQNVTGGRGLVDNLLVQTVPEPNSALLGGLGLLALLRRNRKVAA